MGAPRVHTTTKKELVGRITERTGHPKAVVREVVQGLLDEIIRELADGNRLEFREFGVFDVRDRDSHRAQNPRTLEKVDVPARRVVRFKSGRLMRELVCDTPGPHWDKPKVEEPAPTENQTPAPAPAPKRTKPASDSPF